jgi:hypothetical protein
MALLIDHHAPRHTTERAPRLFPDSVPAPHAPAPTPEPATAAAGPTLDDLLTGTWSRLSAGVDTACPVCTGALAPRWSAGAGIVGGRCRDCGSELS